MTTPPATLPVRLASVLAALLFSVLSAPARGELQDDVTALEKAWSTQDATVAVLPPRVLTQGAVVPLLLPPRGDPANTRQRCTTVAVLGAMSTGFILRYLPSDDPATWEKGAAPEVSVGGAAQLVRCGAARKALGRLAIEMRSPRGVLQPVVAHSPGPLPSLRKVLSHREPGAYVSSTPAGPRPAAGPIGERVGQLERRYRREGADEFHRRLIPVDPSGTTRVLFELSAGCHRLHVLGIPPKENTRPIGGLDVDAELFWTDAEVVAASDRTDSPDAALSVCAGELREAILQVAGAAPETAVLIIQARFALPTGLPERWGPTPRGHVARALAERRIRSLDATPVYEALGISGTTRLSVELEPDACYLATVTPLRGETDLILLSASAGRERVFSHGTEESPAVVAFCASGARTGLLEVEAHGGTVAWLAAVWQRGRTPLGIELE